ncbi:MAG: protein kinase [bacterium]
MPLPNILDIGKYRIVELVGEGAMGVVYRATDTVLHRTVAIKVMNESIARQEDLRQRFLHEAQAAASLQHPNVVSIYDLGEVDGHLFIAMEFVQGVDLEQMIGLGEPVSLQTKLDIMIDVLTGLTFAHKRGIIHRDIKPANIRIAEDGRAKIMDFGVAHLASSKLTSTGASLGTPGYMAPEQVVGGKTTNATDVFAVGAVLYELLTGQKPFDGETLHNLFYKIMTEHPRPLRELKPGLPPALDRIITKALAKEASERYATALEMADELTKVRANLSGPARPSSVSLSATYATAFADARSAARDRMVHIATAGAGILAVVTLVALAWPKLSRARSDSVSQQAQPAPSAPTPSAPPVGVPLGPPAAVSTPKADVVVVPSPPPASSSRTQTKPPRAERVTVAPPSKPALKPSPRPVTSASQVSTPAVTTTQAPPPAARPEIVAPRSPAATPIAPQPAPETVPAAPTAADLAPTIEAYAKAIESRDVAAIRRVYPGLTSDQQRGFEEFFQAARRINVTFRVTNVESSGASADARVSGSYEYDGSSGRTERTPVSFAATLRRDGNAWRLVSLR